MSSGTGEGGLQLIVLEIVLGFGVPIAWGVWQLVELRRLKRRDEEAARRQRDDALSRDEASGTAASPAPSDGQSG